MIRLKRTSYKKLYTDILKIGSEKLGTGLSYLTLKKELENKGYDFGNDCIELAVKQWFYDCFHHRDEEDMPITCVHQIDDHSECDFILKGESCLVLIEHRTSKRNLRIAIIAIVISTISLLLQLRPELNIREEQEIQKSIKHVIHNPSHHSQDTLIGT